MKWTFLALVCTAESFLAGENRDSCVYHAWRKEGWERQCCLRDRSLATSCSSVGALGVGDKEGEAVGLGAAPQQWCHWGQLCGGLSIKVGNQSWQMNLRKALIRKHMAPLPETTRWTSRNKQVKLLM